ncbi:MAG: tetratricopeptide repeat protein [Treponemataceae bacterium]|nr:MAG: tetratricopeptide repeat protein [Treponemataceae bacterium]
MFPVLIAGIAVLIIVIILLNVRSKNGSKEPKQKSRSSIIRDAQKKLTQNPHNPQALKDLSGLYYKEHLWEKAFPLFSTLLEIAPAHPEINRAEAGLRQGVCALKLGRTEESLRGLVAAYKENPNDFDVNYYLGQACYEVKDFVKAVPLLKKALSLNNNAPNAIKWIGMALNQLKHYRDSLQYCKRALELEPGNKDLLFAMAEGLENSGNLTKAAQVYQHLRGDSVYGARACLAGGTIFQTNGETEKAILEFETGLQLGHVPPETFADLHYRLGVCYIKNEEIGKGLQHLKILAINKPGYQDTEALISRYQELSQNSNLQVYLIGNSTDFSVLCRKISVVFFPKARIHITELSQRGELIDMVAEIETTKWEDVVVFRFIRSTGVVSELYIRELHAKLKDTKAGRGIYISAGTFQDGARKFVEGRPIDLIDKSQLVKILQKVNG